eukprot:6467821-Prymnesium_polylepis.1
MPLSPDSRNGEGAALRPPQQLTSPTKPIMPAAYTVRLTAHALVGGQLVLLIATGRCLVGERDGEVVGLYARRSGGARHCLA